MKRDEQRQRTRDALLTAAALEFEEHGYQATSLADVAERLGLVRATVHFHFSTKEGLAAALADSAHDSWLAVLGGLDDTRGPARDRLAAAVRKIAQHWLDDPRARAADRLGADTPASAGAAPAWRATLTGLLADGVRDGSLRPDLTPESDAALLASMLSGVLHAFGPQDDRASRQNLERFLAFVDAALAAPTQLERPEHP